jgi:RNA polymerase sigma-70 factor (ECF subfamily)
MMTSSQSHVENDEPKQHQSNTTRSDIAPDANTGDVSLVRRAQSGERGAFDLLVIKYQRKIISLAMRYTRSPADAEDVSQETFIKAYRGLKHFRCESAFYTWLHRIAINSAKTFLLARARDSAVFASDAFNTNGNGDSPTRLWEMETPEGLSFTDDVHGMVNATLESLSSGHRTAIMLREIYGLSYAAIARKMGIPIGTVRSRVFRAREYLDQQLRQVFDGGLGRRMRRRGRLVVAAGDAPRYASRMRARTRWLGASSLR